MTNPYYNHGSYPTTGSAGASAGMRSELDAVAAGFDKMAPLSGNQDKVVVVNGSGTGQTVADVTGTGNFVRSTSPTLVTPVLGTPASGDGENLTNTIAPQTHAAAGKTTPVDADEIPLLDSAESFGLKKLTWANLKATLATWIGSGAIAGAFTTLSATGNTTLGDSSTDTLNVGNGGLIKDSTGNVGIGVTPSAWSGWKAIDFGGSAALSSTGTMDVLSNAYNNGANWLYKTSGPATLFREEGAAFKWFTAPGGTAGASIPFTQSLAVGLGTTLALEGATSSAGTGISFPSTQLASSNPNTLDDYREGSYTATVVGLTTSPTVTGDFVRVGNTVTLEIPAVSGSSNSTALTLTGLPTPLRPSKNRWVLCRTFNGVTNAALARVEPLGDITFYSNTSGATWGVSDPSKGIGECTISYII